MCPNFWRNYSNTILKESEVLRYFIVIQFFLSNRAVYLLLWNVRLGHEHAGLDFWLSSISVQAPNAPIFVVGSHIDQVAPLCFYLNFFILCRDHLFIVNSLPLGDILQFSMLIAFEDYFNVVTRDWFAYEKVENIMGIGEDYQLFSF